jgi:hypothetical protein
MWDRQLTNTVLELMDVIFDHLGWRPDRIGHELDKPVGVRSRASDNTRIQALTSWEPKTSLAEGYLAPSTGTSPTPPRSVLPGFMRCCRLAELRPTPAERCAEALGPRMVQPHAALS